MSLKNTLSNFASWLFVIITILGLIFFIVGSGIRGMRGSLGSSDEPNWYFVAFGFLLMVPFIIFLIKIIFDTNKTDSEEEERIQNLKNSGHKILVDLTTLEIQTNSCQKEIKEGRSFNSRNTRIEVEHNVALLSIPYKDIIVDYKLNIYMDSEKLKMFFALKENTFFYVDPKNLNNNYLDLSFLYV